MQDLGKTLVLKIAFPDKTKVKKIKVFQVRPSLKSCSLFLRISIIKTRCMHAQRSKFGDMAATLSTTLKRGSAICYMSGVVR